MSTLFDKIASSEKDPLFKGLHTFVNPFSYALLKDHAELYSEFDSIHIDGISLVKIFNAFSSETRIVRQSFDMTSVAPLVFNKCIDDNLMLAVVGSDEKSLDSFLDIISEEFSGIKICYHRNGYFSSEKQWDKSIEEVLSSGAEVVLCGMGALKQEEYLIALKNAGFKGAGYTCGGFIHQTTNGIKYYPEFTDRYNLRWLYRMYDEPKLIKRYFIFYPLSVLSILLERFRMRFR